MKYRQRLGLFDELQTRYRNFLEIVLWKLTGDGELFAEAMQNASLKIWQNIERLNHDKAGGYIYRIAQSSASQAWRNRVKRNGDLHKHYLAGENDPSKSIVERDELSIIRKAISELPNKQSRAIVMRYLQVKDYEKIASEIGCSEATARSHVSKALAALKNKLTKSF